MSCLSRRLDTFRSRPSRPSEFLQSNLGYSRRSIGTMLLGVSDASALRPSSSTRTLAPSPSATTTMKPLEPAPTYTSLVRTFCDRRTSRRLTYPQSNIQIPVSTFDEFRDQISPAHLAQGIFIAHVSHPLFFFFPRTCLYRTTLQPAFGGEEHDFGAVIPV